ncbi:hypothetical protein VN97_g206 [Penicillium thymicola]|uniref:DUF7703 domain-containing protein n=1 Tax=Penicillium thymicola TaxID=293382 RepID=A0AAI9TU13_PENTH|nr:hypothetical protein VN97_g206 [Penicillium thymicola]
MTIHGRVEPLALTSTPSFSYLRPRGWRHPAAYSMSVKKGTGDFPAFRNMYGHDRSTVDNDDKHHGSSNPPPTTIDRWAVQNSPVSRVSLCLPRSIVFKIQYKILSNFHSPLCPPSLLYERLRPAAQLINSSIFLLHSSLARSSPFITMAGESGPVEVSRPIAMVIAGLFALACWNVLQILVSIFHTFKRRRGLYFWSMVIATLGILVHALSTFLRYFDLAPNFPMCVLICISWYSMVTGQSMVLYSRLHLVTNYDSYSRWVLGMIIFNFCVLHIPTTVLFLGINLDVESFVRPFDIYERAQLAGFAAQETIISGLYIWETMTSLKPVLAMKGRRGQTVVTNLIIVNTLAVLLDAALLATEYTNHFDVQTTLKPVVYSIKLMIEFTVLNSLLLVIRANPSAIEDVEQLHHDLHIDTGWSGTHPIGDVGKSDQSDQGVQISASRSVPSWVSFDHQVKPA